MSKKFEPKIVAILCRWCASAGADLAGVSRMKYPANIRPIRVTCSGRVDPLFILRALEAGADGVFIGGCHPGDCHYVDGNIKAKVRIDFFLKILGEMGLSNRVVFEYVSASEGHKFKEVTTEFTKKIKRLGPSPVGRSRDLTILEITEDRRKKQIIHEILTSLADAVGYKADQPFELLEDDVMEGWGFPKRDPEKCIGCYSCYNICPENVITIEDVNDKRTYGSLSFNCMHCKKCEEACPTEALEVVGGFELVSFLKGTSKEDIVQELLSCSDCGKYFASVKQVDYVEQKVDDSPVKRSLNIPEGHLHLCPECKRKQVASNLQQMTLKQAALFTSRRS